MITEPPNLILAASLLFAAIVFVGLAIPLIQRRIKMNNMYGIRFKKAYESDVAWYDINEHGGRLLALSAIPLAALGILSLYVDLEAQPAITLLIALSPAIIAGAGALLSWRYVQNYVAAE